MGRAQPFRGLEQRGRYKTTVLITKYSRFTWKCNQLAGTLLSLYFNRKIEHEKLNFGVQKRV